MANQIVKETLHPDNDNNIDIYPKTSYDQVEGGPDLTQYQKKSELESDIEELGFSKANNLENGTGIGSLVQKRLKSDGVTWTTAKAYQGCGVAFGGNTQAGRTEEEFNAYFWDSATNVPINAGKGKDSNGNILDNHGLTYAQSYSFALANGDSVKALGRSSHSEGAFTQSPGDTSHAEGLQTISSGYVSHSEGAYTEAISDGSHAEGFHTKTSRNYQHVGGEYNNDNKYALFIIGNGETETYRKNAFEVLKDGTIRVQNFNSNGMQIGMATLKVINGVLTVIV